MKREGHTRFSRRELKKTGGGPVPLAVDDYIQSEIIDPEFDKYEVGQLGLKVPHGDED